MPILGFPLRICPAVLHSRKRRTDPQNCQYRHRQIRMYPRTPLQPPEPVLPQLQWCRSTCNQTASIVPPRSAHTLGDLCNHRTQYCHIFSGLDPHLLACLGSVCNHSPVLLVPSRHRSAYCRVSPLPNRYRSAFSISIAGSD